MFKLLLALLVMATTGINFRASSGYVTDGTDETYCLGEPEAYPTTRAGVTFGWSGLSSGDAEVDRNASNDRRLAGIVYIANGGSQATFRVDLPSAGTYEIRLAIGDTIAQGDQYVQIRDGSTPVLTVDDTDGTASATWDDATGTPYNNANWPGSNTAVECVFSGTILNLLLGTPTSQTDSSTIAHLFFSKLASAVLTGTATASITEADVVAGGKTIIATLTGDTFVPASASPLQFVGGNTAGKLGATSGNTTIALNSGLTGGIASAVAAGDLVIAVFGTGATADRTLAITDGSTAYTLLGIEEYANDTFDTNLRVAYKVMGGTPDASTTFGPTGNAADAGAMAVYVFRGVNGTPLDVTVVTANGIDTSRVVPADITPVTAGAFVVCVGAAAHNGGVDTFTSSDLVAFQTVGGLNDTNDVTVGIGHINDWTSGPTNAATWGHSQADSTGFSWAAVTIALRPGAALTPFNDARQAFINGFDSAQVEGTGWDAEVKAKAAVTEVVRTSDTVATWTIAAQSGYNITATETITGTIPASILTGAAAIVATPTIAITAGGGGTTHNVAVDEAVTATASQVASAVFVGASAESGTATATQTSSAVFSSTRAETGAVADSETGVGTFAVTRAETGAVSDTETGGQASSAARTEAVTATESSTGNVTTAAARAETLAVTDGQDATVSSGPQVHNVAVTEALSALDAETGAGVYPVAIAETVTPSEIATASHDFAALITESVTVDASAEINADFLVAIDELLASLDSSTGDFPVVGGRFVMSIEGYPVMSARVEGSPVMSGSLSGGRVLTGVIS